MVAKVNWNTLPLLAKDVFLVLSGILFSLVVSAHMGVQASAAIFLTLAAFHFSKAFIKSRVVEFWLIKSAQGNLPFEILSFGIVFEILSRVVGIATFIVVSSSISPVYLDKHVIFLILCAMIGDTPAVLLRYNLRLSEKFIELSLVNMVPGFFMILAILGIYFFKFDFREIIFFVIVLPALVHLIVSVFYFAFYLGVPVFKKISMGTFIDILLSEREYLFWATVRSIMTEPLKNGFLLVGGAVGSDSDVVILRFAVHAASVGQRAIAALRPYFFNRVLKAIDSKRLDYEWPNLFFSISTSVALFCILYFYVRVGASYHASYVVPIGFGYCSCVAIASATNKMAIASLIEGLSKRYVIMMAPPTVAFGLLIYIAQAFYLHPMIAYGSFFSLYLSSTLVQIVIRTGSRC